MLETWLRLIRPRVQTHSRAVRRVSEFLAGRILRRELREF
jgi:hypothetical protein